MYHSYTDTLRHRYLSLKDKEQGFRETKNS